VDVAAGGRVDAASEQNLFAVGVFEDQGDVPAVGAARLRKGRGESRCSRWRAQEEMQQRKGGALWRPVRLVLILIGILEIDA